MSSSETTPHAEPVNVGPTPAPVRVETRNLSPDRFPELERLQSTVLSDGPRSRKEARHTVVRNRHTGEVHHDAVTIRTLKKSKGRLLVDDKHTITLSGGGGDDQIGKLIHFLVAMRSGDAPRDASDYVVAAAPVGRANVEAVRSFLQNATAGGKAEALAAVAEAAAGDAKVLRAIVERASKDPALFAETAARLNLAAYAEAAAELERLIEADAKEEQFQRLLTRHPWMFGSEYAELLDRRKWTRDENKDFMLRRTTDGYVELIEIKTPLGGAKLFNHDESHDSFYAAAPLSKVLGQVEKYVETLDLDRGRILAVDKEDTLKVRAKIVIGRDGDAAQRASLRRLNGHLHRIEVLTFDQLLRIARNVLGYLSRLTERTPAASELS